ncbi:MAG: thioredoxin-disulfide reductase [Candidatus Shapirobacteria bacterium]|jgi:thioredoxin reductase (NADPH)
MEENIYDTVIIGSGPAGMTAAIYTVRAQLKTLVIAGNQPGGQLTVTTVVENFPGFVDGIGGVKLMMDMMAQAKKLGAEVRQGIVKSVEKKADGSFEVELVSGEKIETRAVIVATGAGAKWLGLLREKELIGRGVSGCAVCDGIFYKGKVVAMIGGGNAACEETSFLAKIASKVYIIHRRDKFRASPSVQKKIIDNPKVEKIWNSEVVEIGGETKVESIKIKDNVTGEERVLPVDGIFVAIGRVPATEFLKGVVELGEDGHVVVGKNTQYSRMTSLEGIFAAGDCSDTIYRQAIVAAGDGGRAAMDAERWLNSR